MTNKLQLSLIAAALSASFSANAVVYKIENIDDFFKVNGTTGNSRSGFGVSANDQGLYIGGASGQFAPVLSEEDEKLLTNNRVDTALSKAKETNTTAPKNLPKASNFIFTFDDQFLPTFLAIFQESIDSETLDGAITVSGFAFDSNTDGLIVGTTSAAANELDDPDQSDGNTYKDLPFYAFDYKQRAFVFDSGVVHTFEPEFSLYGGQSGISAINNNGLVVGYESVAIEPYYVEQIDKRCKDTYKETIPLAVCTAGFSYNGKSNNETRYALQAVSWQYSNGTLKNRTPLGILGERIKDDNYYRYNSIALDVNNNGVAVGRSVAFRNGKKELKYRFDVATVFNNGEVIDLMDHSETTWVGSASTAINDNDVVVGYVTKYINGYPRNKMFVYDMGAASPGVEFPSDFNSGESDLASYPKDINLESVVVGSVDIDGGTSTARRTHAFIYDHKQADFQDLNELLTCGSKGYVQAGDSWTKYQVEATGGDGQVISYDVDISVVDANKITDDGTIMATALVTLPRVKTQWRDEDGSITTTPDTNSVEELVVDANGNVVFDTDSQGRPLTEQIPRAVVLTPTQGTACDIVEDTSQDFVYERSGANVGFIGLLLGGFALFVRRFGAKK